MEKILNALLCGTLDLALLRDADEDLIVDAIQRVKEEGLPVILANIIEKAFSIAVDTFAEVLPKDDVIEQVKRTIEEYKSEIEEYEHEIADLEEKRKKVLSEEPLFVDESEDYPALNEIDEGIAKRESEIDEIDKDIAKLKVVIEEIGELNPREELKIDYNSIATMVWIESHEEIYREYFSSELEDLEERIGLSF